MVPSFPAYEHGNGAAAKEPVQLGSVRVCVHVCFRWSHHLDGGFVRYMSHADIETLRH